MPTAHVSFLSGRAVTVDLPDGFDPSPELTSTIQLDGARNIAYRPLERWQSPPDRDPQLVHRFEVHNGFTRVAVYRTVDEPPPTLVAFWRLPNGYLNTFMQDDYECGADIEGRLRTVIESIGVGVSRRGLPMLTVRAPVRWGNRAEPLQRDRILFMASDEERDDATITLVDEPPWVPEGSASRSDGPTAAGFATSPHRVTVRVNGLADRRAALKEQAERIAATVRPG